MIASALLTDLYQLTMAAAAFKTGADEHEAVFHLFFRRAPFGGRYAVAAGLAPVLEFLRNYRFGDDDLAYLRGLRAPDGSLLFDARFVERLAALRLELDVDAVPEGTVVFPYEPLLRVRGPVVPCMLLETPLLNLINFQTLVATKAARICQAAAGEPVLEFGLRRAQGQDGALGASRAAYLGGAAATSNVLAGKEYGIPVRGTHAHSWVMLYESEPAAFEAYAAAMPNNVVLLVDTYDSLEGIRHAVNVGRALKAAGRELAGIRLDSGDLAWLSIEGRRLLDEAGLQSTRILASNDLDEHLIESLHTQGARVSTWGVGTRLVTGWDEPALGGVYKLSAVRKPGQPWQRRIKVSDQTAKTSIPGVLQVRRFVRDGLAAGDAIYDVDDGPDATFIDPLDPTRRKTVAGAAHEDLLLPVWRGGAPVYSPPPLDESRARLQQQLALFHPATRRLLNPHAYPVGLAPALHARRTQMILDERKKAGQP